MKEYDRLPRKLKKQIPEGPYCYKHLSIDPVTYNQHIKSCPLFKYIQMKELPTQDEISKDYPEERVGYCKWLRTEIDDQMKDCGINRERW